MTVVPFQWEYFLHRMTGFAVIQAFAVRINEVKTELYIVIFCPENPPEKSQDVKKSFRIFEK